MNCCELRRPDGDFARRGVPGGGEFNGRSGETRVHHRHAGRLSGCLSDYAGAHRLHSFTLSRAFTANLDGQPARREASDRVVR